jgi:hypothetical protein
MVIKPHLNKPYYIISLNIINLIIFHLIMINEFL